MPTVDSAFPREFDTEGYTKTFAGYFNTRNYPAAISYVDEHLNRFPSNPKLFYDRAFCLINLKNGKEAIADLDCALALSPNSEMLKKIYSLKGVCHQSLEEIPEAVACYKEAASRGDNYSLGILATVGVIPKKTLSSSLPFDYNIPSTLQETYEDK